MPIIRKKRKRSHSTTTSKANQRNASHASTTEDNNNNLPQNNGHTHLATTTTTTTTNIPTIATTSNQIPDDAMQDDDNNDTESLNQQQQQQQNYLTLYDREEPVALSTFMSTYHALRHRHQQVIQEESTRTDLFENVNATTLTAADIRPLNVFEKVEQYIQAELKRTEHNDVKFDGIRFSELERILELKKSNVPTENQLKEKQKENALFSCTQLGRILNAKVMPRKEKNYITRKMREMRQVDEEKPVAPGSLVCQISIHHPDKNVKQQEFMVLGSQQLTELKDVIYCLYDHVLKGKETHSGYFFIEDTFYVDMRHDDAIDYSKEVIEWTKSLPKVSPYHNKHYEVKRMEHTCFMDLKLKVGERYLFCHQGDCMHYIIFTDVRFWHEHLDEHNELLYPYRTFQGKMKRKKCYACNVNCAEWVTYNDERSPTDPTFYCEDCFRQFHYDEDGNLMTEYDFEAYRYHHE